MRGGVAGSGGRRGVTMLTGSCEEGASGEGLSKGVSSKGFLEGATTLDCKKDDRRERIVSEAPSLSKSFASKNVLMSGAFNPLF